MTPAQFNEKRARLAAKCRYDPLLFAETAWAWGEGTLEDQDIRAWQAEELDELAKHLQNPDTRHRIYRLSIASGHGIGKSALTGILTTWALACWTDPRVVITANTEGQLRTKTSPEVGQWVRTSMYGDLFDVDTLSIKMKTRPDQHRADLTPNSESNPAAFAGLHARGRMVMMIVDEASEIPEIIFETILGALTDEGTVLILILMGNPTSNTGFFRETHRKYRKLWRHRNIDSRTVEGTNKLELQSILDTYGEHSDQAKIRVKGQFPAASPRQFISTADVDAAYGRHLREDQYNFAPKIITCDPAWTGDDELVIAMRQGLKFEVLDVMERNDNDVFVATKIAHLETQHNADAVFIDAGYGTGIYSAGTTMGRTWQLVWFGGEAVDKGCFNKRAEMWRDMRNWLKVGGAIPEDTRLYEDLIGPETKANMKGLIQLEGKEEMKKRLGAYASPNRADALALSFAYPAAKKDQGGTNWPGAKTSRVMNEEFDPEAYR